MDRDAILDEFSKGLNNVRIEKAKMYLSDLIGRCNIYIQEDLLNKQYEKIEEFLKDLLRSKDSVLSKKFPIYICNFKGLDGYKYLKYTATSRIITINKLVRNEIKQKENDINLYLIKNEPDKDYLYRKYKYYFKNFNKKNIFIVFDEFTPNLNKLFKQNIFAIPLTYEKNSGINHFISSEILKVNEEKVINDFEHYIKDSHKQNSSIRSGIEKISCQFNIILKYFKKFDAMMNQYYGKYQEIDYTKLYDEDYDNISVKNNTKSGMLSSYRISQHFEEQGRIFKNNHSVIVGDFLLDFAINLGHMVNELKNEQIDNKVIKETLQFAFQKIYRNKDFFKIIEPYVVKDRVDNQLSILEKEIIVLSIHNNIERNVVLNDMLNDMQFKIKDELTEYFLIPRLKAYKLTENIQNNIFNAEIEKYIYNYWKVDMSNEIKRFFINVYNNIFSIFKNKYTELEIRAIQEEFDEKFFKDI